MPLTQIELWNNYVAAVVYVIGVPYTLTRTDFTLKDDGLSSQPMPYISAWSVIGVPQPSDAYMMTNLSMANIDTVNAVVNLDIVSYDVINSGMLSLSGMPKLLVETSSSQIMANNVTTQVVSAWGTATTSGGMTFVSGVATVPTAGVYLLIYNMAFGYNTNVNKERCVFLEVNSTTKYKTRASANTNDVSDPTVVATCITIPVSLTLAANDTIRTWAFMTTSGGVGGTLTYGSVNGERGYLLINKLY